MGTMTMRTFFQAFQYSNNHSIIGVVAVAVVVGLGVSFAPTGLFVPIDCGIRFGNPFTIRQGVRYSYLQLYEIDE